MKLWNIGGLYEETKYDFRRYKLQGVSVSAQIVWSHRLLLYAVSESHLRAFWYQLTCMLFSSCEHSFCFSCSKLVHFQIHLANHVKLHLC